MLAIHSLIAVLNLQKVLVLYSRTTFFRFFVRIYLYFSLTVPVEQPHDLCNPSPCGANAQCRNGVCSCLPEYQGDPYVGCRPECVINNDCPPHLACIRNKCKDPCPGTCGQNAVCNVYMHIPVCSCPHGTSGNAFIQCKPFEGTLLINWIVLADICSRYYNWIYLNILSIF